MRVEIGSSVAKADEGKSEANHFSAVEGADHLAAGLCGDDEGDVGFDFEVSLAPDGALESDAGVEVGEGVAEANLEVGGHLLVEVERRDLACSQKASI